MLSLSPLFKDPERKEPDMKYLLVITAWSYPPQWPALGMPSIANVSILKSFDTKAQCEAVGEQMYPAHSEYPEHNPPATYKCVELPS